MRKPELRYWVLWLFLLGVLIIVFLQVISGYNINRLIQGNKRLLGELQVQNDFRKLESNILTVESDIRGAVITNNPELIKNTADKIKNIESELHRFKTIFNTRVPAAEFNQLELLGRKKIQFSRQTLQAFYRQGKGQAETVINTSQGQLLRDSIITILARLDELRQSKLRDITSANE